MFRVYRTLPLKSCIVQQVHMHMSVDIPSKGKSLAWEGTHTKMLDTFASMFPKPCALLLYLFLSPNRQLVYTLTVYRCMVDCLSGVSVENSQFVFELVVSAEGFAASIISPAFLATSTRSLRICCMSGSAPPFWVVPF